MNRHIRSIDCHLQRVEHLQNIHVSMLKRFIADADQMEQSGASDLERRRQEHKAWVQIIVVLKMIARALDDATNHARTLGKNMAKDRRDYTNAALDSALDLYNSFQKMRLFNGKSLLAVADYLKALNYKLTPNELQTALSISDVDWWTNSYREKRDLMELVFVEMVGDQSLCEQVVYAMRSDFVSLVSKDDNTRQRVNLKLWSMGLIPTLK